MCSKCWVKIEKFHDFYVIVETNHRNGLMNEIDAKISINPLLDCEPESSAIDATSVKIEFDETVYIPSTSYWDDSEKSTTVQKQAVFKSILNPPSAENQRPILLLNVKEKNESHEKKFQSTMGEKKKRTKISTSTSNKSESSEDNSDKEPVVTGTM